MEKIIWIFSRLVKTCCACFLGTPLCVLEIQNLGLAQLRSHNVIALSVETRDLSWHLLQQNSSLRGRNWNWKAVPLGGNWAWQMGPTWRFPGGGKLPVPSGLLVVGFFSRKNSSPSHDLSWCAKPDLFRTLRVCSKRCTTASCLSSWENWSLGLEGCHLWSLVILVHQWIIIEWFSWELL